MGKDPNRATAKGLNPVVQRLKNGVVATQLRTKEGSFTDVPGITSVLDSIVNGGAAIILGRTSDGGAVSITVLLDGERIRRYAAHQDELDEVFRELAGAFAE